MAGSVAELAGASDVVFTIVGYPRDVREVMLGAQGIAGECQAGHGPRRHDHQRARPGRRDRRGRARPRSVHAVDAPVSGGDIGASEARLSIMIGGEKDVAEALRPLFETMGKTIVHQGPAGAGQHTKMVNQILIATNMIGVCEALLYGYKAGLDLETVMQSVSSGAAGLVEPEQPGRPDHRRQLRAGLLRRAFPQGHGHRPGRIAADEAGPARPGPRRAALSRRRSPGLRPQGHPGPACWPSPTSREWTGPDGRAETPNDARSSLGSSRESGIEDDVGTLLDT